MRCVYEQLANAAGFIAIGLLIISVMAVPSAELKADEFGDCLSACGPQPDPSDTDAYAAWQTCTSGCIDNSQTSENIVTQANCPGAPNVCGVNAQTETTCNGLRCGVRSPTENYDCDCLWSNPGNPGYCYCPNGGAAGQ